MPFELNAPYEPAGELEAKAALEPLFDLLEEGTDDEDLYYAAIWSLSKIGGKRVRQMIETRLDEAEDTEEIQFLEESLENLDFTEQISGFDMMAFEGEDPDEWLLDDEEDY